MQIELAARNAALGWAEIPHTAPEHIRARIIEKRSAMLNRRCASSAPAAPASAVNDTPTEAEREAAKNRVLQAFTSLL